MFGKSGYKSEDGDEMDPPPQHRRIGAGRLEMEAKATSEKVIAITRQKQENKIRPLAGNPKDPAH
jgi:hypothetical protein